MRENSMTLPPAYCPEDNQRKQMWHSHKQMIGYGVSIKGGGCGEIK